MSDNKNPRKVSFNPEPRISLLEHDEGSADKNLGEEIENVFEMQNVRVDLSSVESTGELIPPELCIENDSESLADDLCLSDEKETPSNVDELLELNKIRFLDKSIEGLEKRESISKVRSVVPYELLKWYKNYKKPLVEHYNEISDFLLASMESIEQEIENSKKKIYVREIKNKNFKKLRNDSRSQAKTRWHIFRKTQETKLLSKVMENHRNLQTAINSMKEEIEDLKNQIRKRNMVIQHKKIENKQLNDMIACLEGKNLDEETKALEAKVQSHKILRNSYIHDLKIVKSEVEEKQRKCNNIQKTIKHLSEEIAKSNDAISNKKAGAQSIEKIKQEIKNYETFYNIKFIQSTIHSICFEIYGIKISAILDETGNVSSYTSEIEDINSNTFKAFFCDNLLNKSLNVNPVVESSYPEVVDGSLVEELNIFRRSLVPSMDIGFNEIEKAGKLCTTEDLNVPVQDITSTPIHNRRISITTPLTLKEKIEQNINSIDISADNQWIEKYTDDVHGAPSGTVFENIYEKYKNESIPLDLFIKSILYKACILSNIMKEIENLRTFVKIDSVYTSNKIYLRIYLQSIDLSLGVIFAFIDENLNLFHSKNFVCNLQQNMNGLTSFFRSKINVE